MYTAIPIYRPTLRDGIKKIMTSMMERRSISGQNFALAQKQIDQYIGAEECSKEMDKIWKNCAYSKEFEQAYEKFIATMNPKKAST